MIQSQRTKRRKIRNDLKMFNTIPSEISPQVEIIRTTDNLTTKESIPCDSIQLNNSQLACNDFQNKDRKLVKLVAEPLRLDNTDSTAIFPDTLTEIGDQTKNIKDFIASWAIQFKIPHNALSGLLSGLKEHECFRSFPVDARTILRTPSQISKNIVTVKPGIYYHFGLASGIKKNAPINLSEIKIAVGIDGLPLSKSSGNQFWHILLRHLHLRMYFQLEFIMANINQRTAMNFYLNLSKKLVI